MTVGNQTDPKLQFGMPGDGLPAQLPLTIGFDVNEEGRPLHGGIAPQAPPAQRAWKNLPSQANIVDLTAEYGNEDAQDSDSEAPVTRPTQLTKRGRTTQPPRSRRQVSDDEDDEEDDEFAGPSQHASPMS
ncbi:hypothetical protein AC579_2584 [Pseudocercospora musae]|uniref:Uncharacterized protein n=1 Tax=Pseudocercospora musae TaxID=113226 RepID=A0A139IEL9_9PEZI|nr:hypothetical protein AC579_2584 [Pseudocercospora musae]